MHLSILLHITMVLSFSFYFLSYTLIFIHHTRSNYPNVHHVSRTYFDDSWYYYSRHRCLSIISVNPCVRYKVQTVIITRFLWIWDLSKYVSRHTHTCRMVCWCTWGHTQKNIFIDSFFSNFSWVPFCNSCNSYLDILCLNAA